MNYKISFFLLAVIVTLASCSSQSDDPRQGGLMGGLQGIYGGGDDKRIENKNDQLATQQRLNQDLELDSIVLTKEYQLTDAKLATENQQMLDLEKQVQLLASQVAEQRMESFRQQNDIVHIKLKIAQLQRKIREQHAAIDDLDHAGGSAADPARYKSLQKDREHLGSEYKTILADCKAADSGSN